MNDLETKRGIENSLKSFADKPMVDAATALFESLGYKSEKRITLKPNTPETFVATFAKDKPLNPDNALLADWQSVDFLFQLTDDEVRAAAAGKQQFLFEAHGRWNGAEINSFLFFAITLTNRPYTRTELSGITRAVNLLFPMPAMLLFRHGDTLTLAVIPRRLHKRDESRDVLEKVTLIKDIRFANPHRAHVEILADLSFDALHDKHDFANFVALQSAWQKALDSSELNKRFFLEVANWYFWALHHIEFPKDAPKQDGKDHISVIRLITRLMFCWFIKEKGLVPDVLFDERKLPQILNGFAPNGEADNPVCSKGGKQAGQTGLSASHKESVFYRAILQNLFFATLNTEMDKRGWTKEEQNFMAHSLYRFRESFQKPNEALDLFKNIPFLNGGLFECLDKDLGENAKPRYVRIDGFSRREDSQVVAPDFLFFGPERDVDLSAEYGDNRFKKVKVRGLIHTLNHYKFTVAENTPIEEEIALDPELSGKVFENLLAAYNPETGATARKQTGSFYTPREIVNYMVDEALIACLKRKVEQTILSAPSVAEPAQTGLSASPAFKPYNPEAETHRTHRRLPHWTQEGRTYFVTFRLADSLPQDKLKQWVEEREIWLKFHPEPWSDKDWEEYDDRFGKKLEEWLDAGYGACHLAKPDVRAIVEECLNHFDGQRYDLGGYVVMPNHVHMLIRPREGFELSEIMKGIKGVSSRRVRQTILSASSSVGKGQTGLSASPRFWMDESFDHIVRSQAQFQKFQRYIAENPDKTGLKSEMFALSVEQTILSASAAPDGGQTGLSASPSTESRLRHLFAYNNQPHQFTAPEVDALIAAIDSLKSLDPAVGSGAFPMGILHKLVFILGKLDPRNEKWKERQIARVRDAMAAAEKIDDATVRERAVRELEQQITGINDAFEHNELDYGRKLYLIENCIYGVDIQPIAVQIAKMRFFISLIVDQKVEQTILSAIKEGKPIPTPTGQTGLSASHWNLGIRPLPNLETKFVAANTLIGVNRPGQQLLRNRDIDAKEAKLREVRRSHFLARSRTQKKKCREQDEKLRAEIAQLLKDDGWDKDTATNLASWNPYDQNASANFFDAEWMFGICVEQTILSAQSARTTGGQTGLSASHSGFDIVIANPPYVRQEAIKDFKPLLKAQGYECFEGVADLFVYFYERSVKLLRTGGVLSFITPNKYYRAGYGEKLRAFLARELTLHRLIDFGDAPVFEAIAYASIPAGARAKPGPDASALAYTWEKEMTFDRIGEIVSKRGQQIRQSELKPDGWQLESPAVFRLLEKLRRAGKPLGEYVNGRFYYGIKTGLNEAFVVDRATRDRLIREHKSSAEILKPFLRGRDVKRWRVEPQDLWLIFTRRGIDIKKYPAIYEHLLPLKKQLMPGAVGGRKPGSYEWYEIQDNIAYWQEFEQTKIVIPAITSGVEYAADYEKYFSNDKTSICVTSEPNYLLGLLNSKTLWWFIRQTAASKQGGFYEFKPMYVSALPIPTVTPAQQKPVERLVERILAAKQKREADNPVCLSASETEADRIVCSTLEREIDQQVYALYGLTPEEIKIVEEAAK